MSERWKFPKTLLVILIFIGVLVLGIFVANSQYAGPPEKPPLEMTGNINFQVAENTLYVKSVRVRKSDTSIPVAVENFQPAYLESVVADLGEFESEAPSFIIYFDIINTTDTAYQMTGYTLSEEMQLAEVQVALSGIIGVGNGGEITDETTTNGTFVIEISSPYALELELDGITVTVEEYVETAE